MTATRRASRPGPARWIFYLGAVLVIAWLATQAFYFAQIAIWNYVNPQSTAFMRSDAWRFRRIGRICRCSIRGCRTTRFRAI